MRTVIQAPQLSGFDVDHEPRRRYRNGIDWHRVTFAACLAVAVILAVLAATSKDGKILTLFDPYGRRVMARAITDNFPTVARWLGIR